MLMISPGDLQVCSFLAGPGLREPPPPPGPGRGMGLNSLSDVDTSISLQHDAPHCRAISKVYCTTRNEYLDLKFCREPEANSTSEWHRDRESLSSYLIYPINVTPIQTWCRSRSPSSEMDCPSNSGLCHISKVTDLVKWPRLVRRPGRHQHLSDLEEASSPGGTPRHAQRD